MLKDLWEEREWRQNIAGCLGSPLGCFREGPDWPKKGGEGVRELGSLRMKGSLEKRKVWDRAPGTPGGKRMWLIQKR